MIHYISITGGGAPVDFETAILDGFASDGGLYVPEELPQITVQQLKSWAELSYVDLAFEILSLFVQRTILSEYELKKILSEAFSNFEKEEVIPLYALKSRKNTWAMELFYGPTLSFKDVGLAFLVNLVNFFLERRSEFRTLMVATTGDTGPATAYFTAGKNSLDAWVLFPKGMITEEQERQMTTLQHNNIHPVGVSNCPDGGDDLDLVIAKLYANKRFKEKLKLSSVNSINWGRIMIQMVHYFYGYLKIAENVGERINIAVPSGAFGNLCAGALARKMGLPINTLVAGNNRNATIHRIFSSGILSKEKIINTESSAIDILIPINFWRYLYFAFGKEARKIEYWMNEFKKTGMVRFEKEEYKILRKGFLSYSASDQETLEKIKEIFEAEAYLLDPHGAVAMVAVDANAEQLGNRKLIFMATAHPAKFPKTIRKALGSDHALPGAAIHPSLENARTIAQKVHLCNHSHLEEALIHAMETNWDLTRRRR